MPKSVAVGFEDIKEIIEKNRYYVDKTHMIRDLLDRGGKVNLFVRPRRFGKTLNLSMIRRFFEDEIGQDGTKIAKEYKRHAYIFSSGKCLFQGFL
ncbi:MAG: AAA family ATPase [Eubacterium sp.]|nr:AAA family ATPase [Eubacterium sp.]